MFLDFPSAVLASEKGLTLALGAVVAYRKQRHMCWESSGSSLSQCFLFP